MKEKTKYNNTHTQKKNPRSAVERIYTSESSSSLGFISCIGQPHLLGMSQNLMNDLKLCKFTKAQ